MIINNRDIADKKIDLLCTLIKKKKELTGVHELIVKKAVIQAIERQKKILTQLILKEHIEKSGEAKTIVKQVRALLRKAHGMFQVDEAKRKSILFSIKDVHDLEHHKEMLITHASTKERLPFYEQMYKMIFAETGMPKSILDLGCGLNPFSYPFLHTAPHYYALDINESDCELINQYFKKMQIKGSCHVFDLQRVRTMQPIPLFQKVDVCFVFKLFDTLEITKGHVLAEKLINAILARYIVVSFSLITVSGKQMRHPARGWFERMLSRLALSYKKIAFPNELFYIIKKETNKVA